ncbi:MAG: hypothetical protein JWN44_2518 [Myxococcales bacterium]|nr:hypothetical protein [Myxococcales bacterium]
MRILLSLAALLLLVAPGCGNDATTTTPPDLAMTPADLSAASGDMAKFQTCAQILTCAAACGQNQTCALGCATNAAAAAQGRFITFGQCILGHCGPGDAGIHACTGATDNTPGCQNCIGSTGAAAASMGSACHAEYTACASN